MMSPSVIDIIFSLSVTLLIEPSLIWLLTKGNHKTFITSFASNVFLNVGMNVLLLYVVDKQYYYLFLTIFEISTVILETLIIFTINKTDFWKTLLYVFIANLVSFIVGYIFNIFVLDLFVRQILSVIFFIFAGSGFIFVFVCFLLSFFKISNSEENNDKDNSR